MIWISAIFVIFSIVFDQVTKIIAEGKLQGTDGVVVIPKVLSFSYLENKGAAFGMLSDNRWVFMIFSTVAIGAMVYVLITSKNKHPLFILSLSMLIGGGIGNMIDRIFRGYVIDFLKVLFVDFAVFNVADCFVTVGAILLAVYLLFIYKEPEKKEAEKLCKDTDTEVHPVENISVESEIPVDNSVASEDGKIDKTLENKPDENEG